VNFLKTTTSFSPDSELIQSYKKTGDLDVLALLFQNYMDLVYGVCLKYLKNQEDAQDAVINIYEELIVKVRKYEIEHFKAWIYQLSKNHCLMKLRKSSTKMVDFEDGFMQIGENAHLDLVNAKEIQLTIMEDCLKTLNANQKSAIELFYLESKCYQEIAKMTNMEPGKVKSHIQNGRRNLKICMDNQFKSI
jgi:RNA polymerase sigma-70 factor (ECF subfamily)